MARTQRRAAGLLSALVLLGGLGLLSPDEVVARTRESEGPASAWWVAADMVLARGDCARAVALLEPQLEFHHYAAVGRLGDLHETDQCAELDLPPAPVFYEKLIARGIENAKARLAQLHLTGQGVPRDPARAQLLFKEVVLWLVAHDFAKRRRSTATVIMGRHAVPPALEAELDWADAVEQGPAEQLLQTALALKDGRGLPRHEDAAKRWLQKAAIERQLAAAYLAWGRWVLETEQDAEARKRALGRIRRAGVMGHPAALKEMGLRLARGDEVERNDFAAVVWLLRAREAGEDVAATLAETFERLDVNERIVAAEWAFVRDLLPTFRYEARSR